MVWVVLAAVGILTTSDENLSDIEYFEKEYAALQYGKHSAVSVRDVKWRGRHRVWAAITTYTRTETVGKLIDLGSGIAATQTITFQRTTGSGKAH